MERGWSERGREREEGGRIDEGYRKEKKSKKSFIRLVSLLNLNI